MSTKKVHPLVWGYILFCLVSLALGLGWLVIILPGGFPLGTVATWLMLIALARALLRLAPRMTRRRQLAWLGLMLAVAWYPFSIYMAGNVTLTFHGDSGPWVIWTAVIACWLLILGGWTAVSAMQQKRM
jgi:hypothetical protein